MTPSRESGLALICVACYVYWAPVKTSAKNPDQISGIQGSLKSLHHGGFINL